MRRAWPLVALAAWACAGRETGLGAHLRIDGATWADGAPPGEAGGPAVLSLETTRNSARAGERGHVLRGTVPRAAAGLTLYHPGDPGYWIVPSGPPDAAAPELLTYDLRAEISPRAPAGPLSIEVRASDAEGRAGAARTLSLEVTQEPADTAPLSVTLSWRGAADLDLRVVDPRGVEIGGRNPNSWMMPPPEQEPDPDGWRDGAMLDVDAQAGCARAAAPRERVRWPVEPPPGKYLVRVDTRSLCGDPAATWNVRVLRAGALLAEASGVSTASDTRFAHDVGAGVLALAVEVAP